MTSKLSLLTKIRRRRKIKLFGMTVNRILRSTPSRIRKRGNKRIK